MDHAKRSFNKAANAIFSKVLGVASEELVLHLLKVKCIPILLYATEVLELNNSILQSLDFSVIRFGMKLFKTGNRDLVLNCFSFSNFGLPSALILDRKNNFIRRLSLVDNCLLKSSC